MLIKNLLNYKVILLFFLILIGKNIYAAPDYIQAQNLYVRSIDFIDSGDYNQAVHLLYHSYNIDKHSYTAHALSYCFGMTGDYNQARFYAKEALKLLPPLSPDLESDAKYVVNSGNDRLYHYYIRGKYDRDMAVKPYRSGDPCIYTTKISEESQFFGQECPFGYAIKGIRCRGNYCDDKHLTCCPTNYNYLHNSQIMSGWFSEEPPSGYSNDNSVIVGLWCDGRYCNNLNVKAISVNNVATHCYYTGFFSEEGSGYGACVDGYFASGIICSGDYCDNLNLRCCTR